MPASEAIVTGAWSREGSLFVEPRLRALGVPHGLTARGLGPMAEPERRSAAARAAGVPEDAPLTLRQVHGKTICEASLERSGAEGDGWIAGKGFLVGVFVADCLPVFLWDESLEKIAVVHAGWRGIAAGILEEASIRFGRPTQAAVGPHIGACCYEVGPELEKFFDDSFFAGKNLDLGAAARARLQALGMTVGVSEQCTHCGENDFYSFRREGRVGNMLAFAGVPR